MDVVFILVTHVNACAYLQIVLAAKGMNYYYKHNQIKWFEQFRTEMSVHVRAKHTFMQKKI
jgi:hypothetical protein